jgi:hypothetical protein
LLNVANKGSDLLKHFDLLPAEDSVARLGPIPPEADYEIVSPENDNGLPAGVPSVLLEGDQKF